MREKSPQPPNRPPTPQEAAKPPTQKAPKTGPPKRHRGTTQPKTATPSRRQRSTAKKGHRNMQTHTTLKKQKKEPAAQPERKGMGGQGPQAPGQGQPATDTTKPNQDTPKKKRKKHTQTTKRRRAGHSQDPGPARTPTHRTPARKGKEQAGRAHKHAPPHSNPNQEVQETTRDGRTITDTPQHPPKMRRCAAETQTPARTPTPHTGTGNCVGQAERARNHTRPISRPNPKPNHEHHKQPTKEGQHHKQCPNTHTQDPSKDWRG